MLLVIFVACGVNVPATYVRFRNTVISRFYV